MILRRRLGPLLLGWALLAGVPLHGQAAAESSRFLLVHYMPWFESAAVDLHWGWHWTMNHYDPGHVTNGRRDAASKYRPLVDLYSSGDPDLIECQALLMKFAGVDGVIIDWYGNQQDADYGLIQRNTLQLISWLRRAGLRYTVMYEESTVARLIKDRVVAPEQRVGNGQELFRWMEAHWFSDPLFRSAFPEAGGSADCDGIRLRLLFGRGVDADTFSHNGAGRTDHRGDATRTGRRRV